MAESELQMIERHIQQGETAIARQNDLVSRLKARGLPCVEAENLLGVFREVLQIHRDHLARYVAAHGVTGDRSAIPAKLT